MRCSPTWGCSRLLSGWFVIDLAIGGRSEPVLFFHGGWGKIAAAASTQYVIDRWSPTLLVNLGTCGGFEGEIEKGTIRLILRGVTDLVGSSGGEAYGNIQVFIEATREILGRLVYALPEWIARAV